MYLEKINSPEDLKELPEETMEPLFREIREFLIEKVSAAGGHLASNLGVVELTVAIHRVFDSPHDKIIFDVGHQSYVHKLITGRREGFDGLRRENGISGFTKRSESEHDPFGAGHSSTSLSAALGFARAAKLTGEGGIAVAVVGDGAFTGGMIYEALNNCEKDLPLVVILNDNEMSISRNVGRMSGYISDLRSSKYYISLKHRVEKLLNSLPYIGESAVGAVAAFKEKVRNAVVFDSNIFERMGLRYYGPVDANDYGKIRLMLEEAKNEGKSCIIHAVTKKGMGYAPAEVDPTGYHAVSASSGSGSTFSRAFGKAICRMAAKDKRICAVTAATCDGVGLDTFSQKYPDRFFDVGIAEEHAVTFCAGLSAAGLVPVFPVYSSFLQRAYDNLLHDLMLQKLPLTLCIDRAGFATDDGSTHHGIYDVAFLSQLEDVTVLAPVATESLEPMMTYAARKEGITAVRYQKGSETVGIREAFYKSPEDFKKLGIKLAFDKNGSLAHCKYVFIGYGRVIYEALEAATVLNAEEADSAGVILMEIVSPKDFVTDKIAKNIGKGARVVFVEEGIKNGGAGMLLQSALLEKYGISIKLRAIESVPDRGELSRLFEMCRLDSASLIEAVKEDR